MTALTADEVREHLLGRTGPYADPRVALDPLDNLVEWCARLDTTGRAAMATALLVLLADYDPSVRTGAALGLTHVRHEVDPAAMRVALSRHRVVLDHPPVGFHGANAPTVLGEAWLLFASMAGYDHIHAIAAALDQPPGGLTAADLGAAAAPRLPQLLLWEPTRWFDTAATAVLVAFTEHWQRRSFAMALAPWPAGAVARMEIAARMRGWVDGDIAALRDVMTGASGSGLQPEGLPREERAPGKWWVVDESPYDWAIWRHEHGAVALEVLQRGWAMTCRSRLLDTAEVAAYRTDGAASLTTAVAQLRRA